MSVMTGHKIVKSLAVVSLLLMGGCASTTVPEMFVNYFNRVLGNEKHAECMNDNAIFNNRQLMVPPSAVEDTWTHCLNQSDDDAPGSEKENPVAPDQNTR